MLSGRQRRSGSRAEGWLRLALLPALLAATPAQADDAAAPVPGPVGPADGLEWYSLHAQATFTEQYHPPFTSPFRGPNSLDPGHRGDETFDATLFAGLRLARWLEFYLDSEIDQGFGLSGTFGIAGFPSAEAYKVGRVHPYPRLPRAFFRATVDLGGADQKLEAGANQLAGSRQADNIIVTFGKFSVTDIFDTNSYAHDPRADFLNWALVDAGAFDYAADAWGFTYGGAVEWTQSWWTLRGGVFDLSRVPNGKALDRGFEQFQIDIEGEERHEIAGAPGKLKLLFFLNRANTANYTDAIRLAEETATVPNVALVRRYSSKPGVSLNFEQEIREDLGVFARASLSDGHKEAYDFSDINRSFSTGLSLKGKRWQRPNDTVGLAGVVNDISKDARDYLAAGGLGTLIGDGQLPRAGLEKIIELYYKVELAEWVNFTVDFQHVENPGYDALRGPVEIIGGRLHVEF